MRPSMHTVNTVLKLDGGAKLSLSVTLRFYSYGNAAAGEGPEYEIHQVCDLDGAEEGEGNIYDDLTDGEEARLHRLIVDKLADEHSEAKRERAEGRGEY